MKKQNNKTDIDPKYEFMAFMNGRTKEIPAKHKRPVLTEGDIIVCKQIARRMADAELSDPFVYRRQLSRFISGADDFRLGSQ